MQLYMYKLYGRRLSWYVKMFCSKGSLLDPKLLVAIWWALVVFDLVVGIGFVYFFFMQLYVGLRSLQYPIPCMPLGVVWYVAVGKCNKSCMLYAKFA